MGTQFAYSACNKETRARNDRVKNRVNRNRLSPRLIFTLDFTVKREKQRGKEMFIFQYIEWLCLIVITVCGIFTLPALIGFFRHADKPAPLPQSGNAAHFAVIIPARDESKVIEANIKSIVSADYPQDKLDIYIIVESEKDETVAIAQKYSRVHIFLRKDLTKVGKGYALDECLQAVFEQNEPYDAFLFLDADNVISKDFLARMNDAYQAGYDLACGKRNNKDWNVSAVSAASGLTFTAVNTLVNRPKTHLNKSILISGTGFFVRAERLQETGGWQFHSLTEDYEITTYADCRKWKTRYVEEAVYYDEQPIRLWQSIVQRSRWVKGFFTVRSRYAKMKRETKKQERRESEKTGKKLRSFYKAGMPVICLCITLVAYLVCLLAFFIGSIIAQNGEIALFGKRLLILLGGAYLLIVAITVYLLIDERKSMDVKPSMRVKATLFHPIFLFTYVIAAVRAIFMKNTWEKIDHVIYKEIEEL